MKKNETYKVFQTADGERFIDYQDAQMWVQNNTLTNNCILMYDVIVGKDEQNLPEKIAQGTVAGGGSVYDPYWTADANKQVIQPLNLIGGGVEVFDGGFNSGESVLLATNKNIMHIKLDQSIDTSII